MPHIPIEELLQRNQNFAGPSHVPRPFSSEQKVDSAHTIVISCFDPRSSPEEYLQIDNLHSREIVSIRNAGGHPQHCIHDIVSLDNLLQIHDILVVHHLDCGLTHTTQAKLEQQLRGYVSAEGKERYDYEKFQFGCMTNETLAASCREDVKFLREHPWIRPGTKVAGFVLNIKTGLLQNVEDKED